MYLNLLFKVNRTATGARWSVVLFFILTATALYGHPASAQEVLEKEITVKFQDTPLKVVLDELATKSGLRFMYGGDVARSGLLVTFKASNKSLKYVLDEIFNPTRFNYIVEDKKILVLQNQSSTAAKSLTAANSQGVLPTMLDKASEITVGGKVTDNKGQSLIGVNIVVKGTTVGTTTDENGGFSLKVENRDQVLVFSFVGFQTKEVELKTQTRLEVVLQESDKTLEEIVVVGYGTQKKRDLTGAVAQISATRLENENPASVQDILRGNISGLNVGYSTTAKPASSLQVRGSNTLNANGDPLIVLDGIIYYGQLLDINPNDIQTIDVLKDASSAAVYGAKAANGVILITTKSGQSGKAMVTLNTNTGITSLAHDQPLYNANDFLYFRADVQRSMNANQNPLKYTNPNALPASMPLKDWLALDGATGDPTTTWLNRLNLSQVEIDNYKAGRTNDWYKKVFQQGVQQDYNVSVSGKNDDISYYISLGYMDNQGIVVGDRYRTFRSRLNLDARIAKFLKIGINTQFSSRDDGYVPVVWSNMVNASPWGSEFDDKGNQRLSPQDDQIALNPALSKAYTNRLSINNTLISTIYSVVTLPFGITYQANFSPRVEGYRYFNHQSADSPQWAQAGGYAQREQLDIYSWQIDNLFKWKKTFGKSHDLDITFLANLEKYQSWQNRIENSGFDPSDQLGFHNIGTGKNPIVTSNDEYGTADALMGRLFYSFKSRYMLTLSLRRDGYSAFGQKNPRATFPAAALGWVISDEKFFNSSWLNYLKLRFSYGFNGNRDIGRYVAISDLVAGKYLHVSPTGTLKQVSMLYVNRMSNENLQWEKKSSLNIGVDFSMLRNRISGSIETYTMTSTNLLVQRSLPDVTGFKTVWANLGEIRNRGIELNLTSVNINTPLVTWKSTLNFSMNRNKIISLYGDRQNILDSEGKVIGTREPNDITNKWFIGQPLDVIWDIKILGVYQKNEAELAQKYGVKPGDFKLQDVNNDGKYTDADRQFLGYTEPRFRWTLRNELRLFKRFDVSFMMYSYWGNKGSFNTAKNQNGYMDRVNAYMQPYWTAENPINDYARLSSSDGSASYSVYRDRSFVRLENVSVAYNLPANVFGRLGLKNAKAYFSVRNVAVYSREWSFWDPENGAPTPRTATLGINVSL
ncbi:SusC/RagA family TonB-linked outer membrane protein [Larkinella terrae]|nr:SusC/RagA family TonB-linked outer membrane protein [Larkinella terrae]